MAMFLKTIILLVLVSFTIQIQDEKRIKCGKDNPTKESHCTKYGTDSGFLCCWIKNPSLERCGLMSYGEAKDKGIKGTATVKNDDDVDTYYSCGNNSSYLKYTFAAISFALFGILLL